MEQVPETTALVEELKGWKIWVTDVSSYVGATCCVGVHALCHFPRVIGVVPQTVPEIWCHPAEVARYQYAIRCGADFTSAQAELANLRVCAPVQVALEEKLP